MFILFLWGAPRRVPPLPGYCLDRMAAREYVELRESTDIIETARECSATGRKSRLAYGGAKGCWRNCGGLGERYSPADVPLTCSWGGVGSETVEGCLSSETTDADADASGVIEAEAEGVREGWV